MKVVNKRLRKDRVFLLVLLLFFSTIFIFSAFKVIEWLNDNNNTDKVIDKINNDVKVDEVKDNDIAPLSLLTDGVHLHTITVPDEETLERIKEALDEKHILLK